MAQLKTKTINKNRQYQMRNIFKVVEDRIVTFIVCLVLWLGLVAGKSCNFWVSCNIWVLQPVGYHPYWQNVIGNILVPLQPMLKSLPACYLCVKAYHQLAFKTQS